VVERDAIALRSRATREVIDELDRVASADGQHFACLWVVSDLDFDAVNETEVGPARLLARGGGRPDLA
jgi:hypothetical protein